MHIEQQRGRGGVCGPVTDTCGAITAEKAGVFLQAQTEKHFISSMEEIEEAN